MQVETNTNIQRTKIWLNTVVLVLESTVARRSHASDNLITSA